MAEAPNTSVDKPPAQGYDMDKALGDMNAMLNKSMEFQTKLRAISLKASMANAGHTSMKSIISNIGQA